MSGGGGPTSITNVPPAILPADYPFRQGLFSNFFPNLVGAQMPNYQQAGGQFGGAPSPTQQQATHMAQQWATSGPQFMGGVQGTLGNLANQTYQPGAGDEALNRFLAPSFINPEAAGPARTSPFSIGGGNGLGPGGGGPEQQVFTPQGQGAHQRDISDENPTYDPQDPPNRRPILEDNVPTVNQGDPDFVYPDLPLPPFAGYDMAPYTPLDPGNTYTPFDPSAGYLPMGQELQQGGLWGATAPRAPPSGGWSMPETVGPTGQPNVRPPDRPPPSDPFPEGRCFPPWVENDQGVCVLPNNPNDPNNPNNPNQPPPNTPPPGGGGGDDDDDGDGGKPGRPKTLGDDMPYNPTSRPLSMPGGAGVSGVGSASSNLGAMKQPGAPSAGSPVGTQRPMPRPMPMPGGMGGAQPMPTPGTPRPMSMTEQPYYGPPPGTSMPGQGAPGPPGMPPGPGAAPGGMDPGGPGGPPPPQKGGGPGAGPPPGPPPGAQPGMQGGGKGGGPQPMGPQPMGPMPVPQGGLNYQGGQTR